MLQETYLLTSNIRFFKSLWGGQVFYSSAVSNHSCGVLIACNPTLNCNFSQFRFDQDGRFVSILCTIQDFSFRICNVYAPCVPANRVDFFENLFYYLRGNYPVILGGDFNCVLFQKDRLETSANTSSFVGKKQLGSIISSFRLIDSFLAVNSVDAGHTWFHPGKRQSSRIDRVYVAKDFKVISSRTIPFQFSDHCVVHSAFRLPSVQNSVKSYWKFNASFCDDDLFVKEFTFYYNLWQTLKPGYQSISLWWESVKGRVRDLCIKHGAKLARERRKLISEKQRACILGGRDDISNLLLEEGRGAYVRAREKFIEGGEKPGYFNKQEKKRAQHKEIKEIRDGNGRVVTGDQIASVFHEFYSNLFQCNDDFDVSSQDVFISCISKFIDSKSSDLLNVPISLSELHGAIFKLSKNKSPGIDGLSVEFYQCFYHIICNDLLDVYNDIFVNGSLSVSQATAVIILIPKSGDKLDPRNKRPISLLTVDYKIISKVLQLRCSSVLSNIINELQTCSVPGRSIHSNLILIRDIIDYSTLRDINCAIISVDQSKAFDKVNWDFMFKVLDKFNFGKNIIRWIKILYSNISCQILVNGKLGERVQIHRGVRQGCPLSPILYILYIEPLMSYISNHVGIRGFYLPGGGGRAIKTLQYADDTTIICTSQSDIINYFKSFQLFEKATGSSLNLNKTNGLKLGGFIGRKLKGEINWGEDKIEINGICFGKQQSIYKFWKSLSSKAKQKLDKWENRGLTILGKIEIINSCIFSLLYYPAYIYVPPDDFYTDILRIVYEFIWAHKTELVKRDAILLDYDKGGLKLIDLKCKMKSMFIFNVFRFITGDDLSSANYLLFRYFLGCKLRSTFSFLFSNLVPHADRLSVSYSHVYDILLLLLSRKNDFYVMCRSSRDVAGLLAPVECIPRVVSTGSRDWPVVWRMAHHPLLCSALRSFHWKFVHNALVTNSKRLRWGKGDGKCKFCSQLETLNHILWDCNYVYNILCWVYKFTVKLLGNQVMFNENLFLYGCPNVALDASVWARVWYLFVVIKKFIWSRRCTFVFDNEFISDDELILRVKDDLRVRLLVDLKRWPRERFKKIWVNGVSFCSISGGSVVLTLP